MKALIIIKVLFFLSLFANVAMAADQLSQSILFGGVKWNVREARTDSPPVAPGNNYYSSTYGAENSVYVDELGRLHLAILEHEGVWYSAEVSSDKIALEGKYRFRVTLPNTPPLDPMVAVAIFLYSDDDHEYDIEISEFLSRFDCSKIDCASCISRCENCQLQFTRQPFCENDNWQRLFWPGQIEQTIHEILWEPGKFVRLTVNDKDIHPQHTMTHEFTETAESKADYRLHLSIWLQDNGGEKHPNKPSSLNRQEAIFELLEIPPDMASVEK